ncbi:MAG: hypothetical protein QW331_00790 [Candidatus Woesearchaeota archaeon]
MGRMKAHLFDLEEDPEEVLERVSDERIQSGQVLPTETEELEKRLIRMFFQHAKASEREVVCVTDHDEYERLRASGELFEGIKYYLLVNKKGDILDMNPIIFHLLRTTPLALQYSKLKQQGVYLRS